MVFSQGDNALLMSLAALSRKQYKVELFALLGITYVKNEPETYRPSGSETEDRD